MKLHWNKMKQFYETKACIKCLILYKIHQQFKKKWKDMRGINQLFYVLKSTKINLMTNFCLQLAPLKLDYQTGFLAVVEKLKHT